MLNFDLFLLLNLFLRRPRKQHKDYGSELTISVLKGILVIIRCVLYIFRKEISKGRGWGGGGGVCLSNVPTARHSKGRQSVGFKNLTNSNLLKLEL